MTGKIFAGSKFFNRDQQCYTVDVPAGKSGHWEVKHFTLIDDQIIMGNLRARRDGTDYLVVKPGSYTSLVHDIGGTVMSNTRMEYLTSRNFVNEAEGDVLLTGLGLGMLLRPLFENPAVRSVTVIERDYDVIKLVAPSYADLPNLEIIEADVWTWKPEGGRKFSCAWHDIWGKLDPDNLAEMTRLCRRYRKWVTGQQGCWSREEVRREKRRYG